MFYDENDLIRIGYLEKCVQTHCCDDEPCQHDSDIVEALEPRTGGAAKGLSVWEHVLWSMKVGPFFVPGKTTNVSLRTT